ncbi:MAG: bifunctional methylenetetrahydrofolate dehydrogenase/methenyltetrahydrofolate cyclohydrolase FolD [Acutalibacteraceae bacterium]
MVTLIDGKAVSAAVKESVRLEVEQLKNQGIEACLAVIIVGSDPASRVYVNNKKKACELTGIRSEEYALPEETTQQELLSLIDRLNADEKVNGILCQLPLPKHIDENTVIERIDPKKDVDMFSCVNVGKMWVGDGVFLPCTPAGVMELLSYYHIDLCGKNCVVVGRSNIVGKPMACLLLEKNATVTVCHSRTKNLGEICRSADLIVAAVGKAKFITADMVKDGAVVVDVGINRNENGKLCGDVDFENVKEKASFITPVPGGCGPMTIAMLMKNTVAAVKLQNNVQ